jgi:uncharacterized protein YukE
VNQKPLIERLSRTGTQTGELDPALLAASFGAIYPPGGPLPDSGLTENHVEDDQPSAIPIDERKLSNEPKPAPRSLLEIAKARLHSLEPRTAQRKMEVWKMLGTMIEPLRAVDELVATLEREHFATFTERWEQCLGQGRELVDSLPTLQRELAAAQQAVREADQKKANAIGVLQSSVQNARKISRWATEAEISEASRKTIKAREEMQVATDKALLRMKQLAEAEGKLATVQKNLEILKTDMARVECSLKGVPFHDPETGLSVDPTAYKESW